MTKKLFLSVIVLTVTLLSAGTSFAAVSEQAIQDLYKAAKAEGEVIWQVGGTLRTYTPAAKAFEAVYPGVKCSVIEISATTIHTRIITEAAAGRVSLDVGGTMTDILLPLLKRDLLIKQDWSRITDSDPNLILFDGAFVISYDHPRSGCIIRSWFQRLKRQKPGRMDFIPGERVQNIHAISWPVLWRTFPGMAQEPKKNSRLH